MGWHFNDLDVYVSSESDVLGETSYENWFAVSSCGLVRGRPTVTRSSNSTTKAQIPGTIGEKYSLITQRSNAKIQFEVLVGDIWPHEHLKQSGNTFLQTVLNRALYLEQVLTMAKRVAVKEQGHPTQEYYEVMDVAIELNDADEKAAVIKCTMEVYPFIYDFSRNEPQTVAAGNTANINNLLPYSECHPIYILTNCGQNKEIQVHKMHDGSSYSTYSIEIKNLPAGQTLVIDTKRMQAYDQVTKDPLNRYLKGDYEILRIPQNYMFRITNGTNVPLQIYTRQGLRI